MMNDGQAADCREPIDRSSEQAAIAVSGSVERTVRALDKRSDGGHANLAGLGNNCTLHSAYVRTITEVSDGSHAGLVTLCT